MSKSGSGTLKLPSAKDLQGKLPTTEELQKRLSRYDPSRLLDWLRSRPWFHKPDISRPLGEGATRMERLWDWIWASPWHFLAVLAILFVLLHTWILFKTSYSAKNWALKPERHAILKGLAYAGALPLRLLQSLLGAVAATAVWAVILVGAYALWKAVANF